jgi:mevalonate kinase
MGGAGHACGKAIVLGEHAVVYGVPAIAVGIDRGASAYSTPLERGPSHLLVRGWGLRIREDEEHHDLARAFRALLLAARRDTPSLGDHAVEVEAHLPPGGGLGCSAAIGVAIARALEPRPRESAVQERAMAWERVFHGNPSGVDAAVAARGGCVVFRKGAGIEPLRVRGPIHLCVGSTGTASSTKAMVEAVARLRSRSPQHVDQSFEEIRALVHSGRQAFETGDRSLLGRLMNLNQLLLRELFLSTPEIERMCSLARGAGALGAKLTGAGGGGSVLALVSGLAAADAVLASWKSAHFDGFVACVTPEIRAQSFESENTT